MASRLIFWSLDLELFCIKWLVLTKNSMIFIKYTVLALHSCGQIWISQNMNTWKLRLNSANFSPWEWYNIQHSLAYYDLLKYFFTKIFSTWYKVKYIKTKHEFLERKKWIDLCCLTKYANSRFSSMSGQSCFNQMGFPAFKSMIWCKIIAYHVIYLLHYRFLWLDYISFL